MAERDFEVQTMKTVYICDECGKGEMRRSGHVLTSMPPQYPHACTNCDAKKTFFDTSYPQIWTRAL